jgi:hypothetical protein
MNSKFSEGSDVTYINLQSWHFLDGNEERYRKPELHLWSEIQNRISPINFRTKKA